MGGGPSITGSSQEEHSNAKDEHDYAPDQIDVHPSGPFINGASSRKQAVGGKD
jgi:hypothetical protein